MIYYLETSQGIFAHAEKLASNWPTGARGRQGQGESCSMLEATIPAAAAALCAVCFFLCSRKRDGTAAMDEGVVGVQVRL